ncbi:MAG: triose-phosphate isomerase [Pseudomonadota bacterium]
MRPLIAGNWKMNGLSADAQKVEKLIEAFDGAMPEKIDVLICPPATLLAQLAAAYQDEAVQFGGQDCHAAPSGAHTGDVSAEMLADIGAAFVIVGHSERRGDYGESDAIVKAKAEAALRAGLAPIICVGETEAERDAGEAEAVVARQLEGSLPAADKGKTEIVIAYEPVWAIGTGRTPTGGEIKAMHAAIRRIVGDRCRILYGGSVKPGNAAEILKLTDVDGALVGGASLKAADFATIIRAA